MEKITKRKRACNWCEEDKILLRDLVKERVAVIENKNTDTNTNQKKKAAWVELEESFNTLCQGEKRNVLQLKSQWTLTKIQAKKEHALNRRQIRQTGGGPKPSEEVLKSDDISVWLPNEFFVDTNEFDSDAIGIEESMSAVIENSEVVSTKNLEKEVEESQVTVLDDIVPIEDCQKKKLEKKKKSPLLCQNLASDKIKKLAEFEFEKREELHNIQMENERKRSRNLDLEFEILQLKKKFYEKKTDW